jgi:membrane protease YdiL (CAAX protease family)
MLAFLAPLVVAYEAGLAWILRTEQGVLTNKAHETLLIFFESMGVPAAGGLYLGGLVIVVVLLVWHVLNRDAWRIDLKTAGLMACESLLLAMPLLALGILVQRHLPAMVAAGVVELDRLDIWSKMAISVGAGLYEELMFRMMLIAIAHTLLVDLGRLPNAWGIAIAIALSAVAFAVYHPLRGPDGTLVAGRLVFYLLAGVYFGAVYVLRGFGIVVAVHALYDIITVSLLTGPADG